MTTVLRDGISAPMATVAAAAGVGVGTLYRHFPTREALLAALTHRSFEQVLANARAAETDPRVPLEQIRDFLAAAVRQRATLLLPLHGGPPVADPATKRVRADVHDAVTRILDAGILDGSIRADAMARDVVIFGAMLAQPLPAVADWERTARRLTQVYLDGLAATPTRG